MKNRIAVFILFFNKLEETKRCIESFLPSGVVVHILNNGSDPALWRKLRTKFSAFRQCKFYEVETNRGPAQGRNFLIDATGEEWIFLVDNDITLKQTNTWMETFEKLVAANPAVNVICPELYNVHECQVAKHPRFQINGNRVLLNYTSSAAANYFPSGAAIVKRDVFSRFKLFDHDLFAFEDYEFAIRVLKHGDRSLNILDTSEITLVHNHRFQKKAIDKRAVRERYNEVKLDQSFMWIQHKHNVVFEHDWRWWTRKQVKEMTSTRKDRWLKWIKNF